MKIPSLPPPLSEDTRKALLKDPTRVTWKHFLSSRHLSRSMLWVTVWKTKLLCEWENMNLEQDAEGCSFNYLELMRVCAWTLPKGPVGYLFSR